VIPKNLPNLKWVKIEGKIFFFSAWKIEEVEAFSHGCKNVFGFETGVFCVVERELSELG
jgi:hypothetical protein